MACWTLRGVLSRLRDRGGLSRRQRAAMTTLPRTASTSPCPTPCPALEQRLGPDGKDCSADEDSLFAVRREVGDSADLQGHRQEDGVPGIYACNGELGLLPEDLLSGVWLRKG